MRILAIETSCDETAIALLDIEGELNKPDIKVLGNTLLSQIHLHEKYGGVYPNLAKREHQKNLPILLEKTFLESGENFDDPEIDLIAVTQGPGLEPALWTGITFAKDLALKWQKPLIPVNHMEGHIFSVLFEIKERLEFPSLALLVSGGHTELVQVRDFGKYEIIGRTRDDAVGEAFDKVARMLGLSYPGGPKISFLAEKSRSENRELKIKFPRPMIHSKDLDFSFSGLKTAVLYKLKREQELDEESKEAVARAFEEAAIEVLVEKTRGALLKLRGEIKTLIVAGGVSANFHLRNKLTDLLVSNFPKLKLLLPVPLLTTDNALMIGITAFIKTSLESQIIKQKVSPSLLEAVGNLSLTSWQK